MWGKSDGQLAMTFINQMLNFYIGEQVQNVE